MQRSHFWLRSVFFALLLFVSNTNSSQAQGTYTASYQDFYDGLSPYGQWIQDPQYGYVWLPYVEDDFRPYYTNGYWASTQYGNTWVSGYDWGWAPFHYGRWTYDNYYGWLWIPDTEWAPAWVSWRSSNDYYGWAPMGPGINININLGGIPVDWWMFVSPGYFYDRSFYRYCNNDYRFRRGIYSRTQIINYTYIDNRTTYYTGPRADDYYRHTGRRPSMYNIDNNNRRGATRVKGDRISVYRPEVRNTRGAAPVRVVNTERAVTRRPQVFNGTAAGARGRELIMEESRPSSGRTQRMSEIPASSVQQKVTTRDQGNMQVQQRNGQWQRVDQNNVPVQQQRAIQTEQQRGMQVQQQRAAQMEQQRAQQAQQRDMQVQQQRTQQQRAQQEQQRDMQVQQQRMQQQRAAQMKQQRAQQEQQRDMQVQQQRMQQQRAAQMEQQRAQQEQQRDMQVQQQRMQQQRAAQMEQQRAQQEQQRDMQVQQQRAQQAQQRSMQIQQQTQPVQRQQESPMRMHRDGGR